MHRDPFVAPKVFSAMILKLVMLEQRVTKKKTVTECSSPALYHRNKTWRVLEVRRPFQDVSAENHSCWAKKDLHLKNCLQSFCRDLGLKKAIIFSK